MQDIYASVKAKLEELPEIKMIELWYGQYDDPEEAKLQRYPSVAVEFADIQPRQGVEGVVEGSLIIRLRIAHKTLKEKDEDLQILALRDKVNRKLNGHGLEGAFTGLNFAGELMDVKAAHLLVWQIDFKTEYRDMSGYWYQDEVAVNPLEAQLQLPGGETFTISG